MGLESLSSVLKRSYRTGRDQVVPDFYIPCFKQSVRYDRAVGYFTSASLSLAARGVVHMVIQNKGKMRLVASPDLLKVTSLRCATPTPIWSNYSSA